MRIIDRLRAALPAGMTGLTGLACAACCVLPLLLAAGVLGGAGWAALGQVLPGVTVVLAAITGLAWWQASRRRGHASGCAAGACSCAS
jgi:hypothetical protein